jgi:EAL domain-containing protein (putative c-di-GMP-specific phosphodiesterase class I)/sensor domain CHASE-containing protein
MPSVRCQTDCNPGFDTLIGRGPAAVESTGKMRIKANSSPPWLDRNSRDRAEPREADSAAGRNQGSASVRAWAILVIASVSMWFPATRSANVAVDTLDAQPAILALDDVRRAWLGQLNELIATARALAVADDTYEFVKRPNIPYIEAHYDPERLTAERIDTVLIVDLRGKPLFWRLLNQGSNRGFPDARLFLAELPPLPAPGVAGEPSLAGAATLVHGPKLLVAMPIYASSGFGVARGWLIAARALDAPQWHRYEELAHVPVQLLDPQASQSTGDVEAALQAPLAPIVRVEAQHIRGFMAVSDLQGRPFKVFSVSLARQEAAVGSAAVSFLARSIPRLSLLLLIASAAVAVVATGMVRHQSRKIAWLGPPQNDNVWPPAEAANLGSSVPAIAPVSAGFSSAQARDSLRARLAASHAVFRYQPQIDLQTGRVAGVEALLCVPGADEFRPAIELAAEIEAAGLGPALVEHRLHDACREQRAWLRTIGHEFPIGVPVSQRALVDAAFLPLLQSILAEYELAPALLELQVEEAALGPSAAALRSVTKVRDAGLSIAIDGYNAAHSNLRLLSILPISKLRVDPYLLLRAGDTPSEALLFDGIVGAARGLGIMVCATGIDSPELLSTVLRHGRPVAQGAALGPALAGQEFLELLRGNNTDTATLRTLDFDDERLQPDSA